MATAPTEYKFELPEQAVAFPEITPGCVGTGVENAVTPNVCGVEEQEALLAVTEILPLWFAAVAEIDTVLEVPVHPKGNVHV